MRHLMWACTVLLTLAVSPPAAAEVEWDVIKTLSLEKKPLDVAVSEDGQSVYVLLQGGRVQIHGAGGNLRESLDLGFSADSIALSPAGTILYAAGGKEKSVRVIRQEIVQQISAEGSPGKGAEDAPVTVAVFNDFQ